MRICRFVANNNQSSPSRLLRFLAAAGSSLLAITLLLASLPASLFAQEAPYFITYNDELQEPGTLEVSLNPIFGVPKASHDFLSYSVEFEYGATEWWTTSVYLDGQHTWNESSLFTGFRWENRFRLFRHDHRMNPVFYLEYEHINGADKTLQEVVGFDSTLDTARPNSESRLEGEREIETKLILSSDVRGWNFSENFIAEKNFSAPDPWEFGYALGASRPLARAKGGRDCTFCRKSLSAGVELYGGLGTSRDFTLAGTSHYLAPVVAWNLDDDTTLRFSPGFGLTPQSHRTLIRIGVSYEISEFGRQLGKVFR